MKINTGIEKAKDYRRTAISNVSNTLAVYTQKRRIKRIIKAQAELNEMVAEMQFINQYHAILVPVTTN